MCTSLSTAVLHAPVKVSDKRVTRECGKSQSGRLKSVGQAELSGTADNCRQLNNQHASKNPLPLHPRCGLRERRQSLIASTPTTPLWLQGEGEVKELQRLLTYHVLSGTVFSEDFQNNAAITTLEGDTILAHVMPTGAPNPGGSGALEQIKVNDATLITVDVPASNGVIHVIDTVLVPPTPAPKASTIFKAVEDSGYTTFVAALKAGVLERSGIPWTTQLQAHTQSLSPPTKHSPSCLLALDHLLDPKIGELQDILEYHIIAGKALRAGCTKTGRTCGPDDIEGDAMKLGFQPATAFWKKLSGGSVVAFEGYVHRHYVQQRYYVLGDSTNIAGVIQPITITGEEDVFASNGIWHVIDRC